MRSAYSLRRRLLLIATLVALSLTIILISAWGARRILVREMKNLTAVLEITKGSFEITVLSQDFASRHSERATRQWRSKIESTKKVVQSLEYASQPMNALRASIEENLDESVRIFNQLVELIDGSSSLNVNAEGDPRVRNYSTQLLLLGHRAANSAARLSDLSTDRLQDSQRTATYVISATVLGSLAFVLICIFATVRRIRHSVNSLSQEIQIFGDTRGPMSPELDGNDEFSTLAREFHKSKLAIQARYDELIADLASAKMMADRANNAKRDFLANVSHEIRTPLGIIDGFSSLLAQSQKLDEEESDFLKRIRSNVRVLTGMIDELMDFSKIEAGKMELQIQRVNLLDLVQDSIDNFRTQARSVHSEIRFQPSEEWYQCWISTDAKKLQQILSNLLSNAIKFSNARPIQVELTVPDDSGELSIDVVDQGIGMTPKVQAKLFHPFEQGDSSISKKFGGTGLGLVISRKLARMLGGDVDLVSSQSSQGSRFRIRIPRELSKPVDRSSKGPVGPDEILSGSRKLILCVEDNPDNRELFAACSKSESNLFVEFAETGSEALKKVQERSYDLVFMDLQLPGIDGIETTSRLRQGGFTAPIVAVTAYGLEYARELQTQDNRHLFDSFLSKPITQESISGTVAQFFNA